MTENNKLKNYISSISANTIIGFYFLIPIVIGMLLSDVFGLDISDFIKRYFGLFRAVEGIGKDIQTKSMIFFIAMILSPLVWLFLIRGQSENPERTKKAMQRTSTRKLFFLVVVGAPIGFLVMLAVLIHETHLPDATSPLLRPDRIIVGMANFDVLFGLFSAGMLFAAIVALASMFSCTKELYLRLTRTNR